MRRIGFVCAAVALGLLASPVAAQQVPADQRLTMEQPGQAAVPPAPPPDMAASSSVPPAPPPDVQISPGGLPPFPPMSKRPPQHRWVDMGDHHRPRHVRRAPRTHHKAKAAHRRASHARHRLTRKQKDLRYCHALSHRRMMHNHRCVTLVRHEKAAKHRHGAHRHKATHHRTRVHRRRHHVVRHRGR
jgi:hypothetical protein